MPKVSVIVPIYGVEDYIERCAISLFQQTLTDMEFIFVDDCSEDNSMEILSSVIQKYQHKINQIKVLHHNTNRGLSFARETGVKFAQGEYIAHCDSDDWIDSTMFEEMYNYARLGDYDIVKCGFYTSDGNSNSPVYVYTENDNTSNEAIIKYLLTRKNWNNIWNILVKRELYNNIKYTNFAMLEDFYVVSQLLIKADKIGIINKPYYYYYKNNNSISRKLDDKSVIEKSRQAEINITEIITFIKNKYNDKFRKETISLLFVPRLILIPIMHKVKYYRYWYKTTPHNTLNFILSPYISTVHKLWYLQVELFLRPIIKIK